MNYITLKNLLNILKSDRNLDIEVFIPVEISEHIKVRIEDKMFMIIGHARWYIVEKLGSK